MKICCIAIVEDDLRVNSQLALLLRSGLDTEVLEYHNGESALSDLAEKEADIVLVDINLPGMSGIEFIRKLKILQPPSQCIVLTVYDQPGTIFEALQAGATGYLLKSTPVEKIMEGIIEVFQGGSPISSQIARKVIEAFTAKTQSSAQLQLLSRREREILEQLSLGLRYQEIADHFFLSLDTIRSHVRNIYEKLQVNSRGEALKKTGLG